MHEFSKGLTTIRMPRHCLTKSSDDPYHPHREARLPGDDLPVPAPAPVSQTDLNEMCGQVQRVNRSQRHHGESTNELRENTVAIVNRSHKNATSVRSMRAQMRTPTPRTTNASHRSNQCLRVLVEILDFVIIPITLLRTEPCRIRNFPIWS